MITKQTRGKVTLELTTKELRDLRELINDASFYWDNVREEGYHYESPQKYRSMDNKICRFLKMLPDIPKRKKQNKDFPLTVGI